MSNSTNTCFIFCFSVWYQCFYVYKHWFTRRSCVWVNVTAWMLKLLLPKPISPSVFVNWAIWHLIKRCLDEPKTNIPHLTVSNVGNMLTFYFLVWFFSTEKLFILFGSNKQFLQRVTNWSKNLKYWSWQWVDLFVPLAVIGRLSPLVPSCCKGHRKSI